MMDVLVKRETVPLVLMAKIRVQGVEACPTCEIAARLATIITPYGNAILAQAPGWSSPVVMWHQGRLLSPEIIQGLFEEINEHDIPDDQIIRLHRPEPQPGQIGM
jgi:hypothetical protein